MSKNPFGYSHWITIEFIGSKRPILDVPDPAQTWRTATKSREDAQRIFDEEFGLDRYRLVSIVPMTPEEIEQYYKLDDPAGYLV